MLRRYLSIWSFFLRNVLIESMSYRLNFFLMVLINSGWFFVQLFIYFLIFSRVRSLAGWGPYEVVFLASTWQIIFCSFIALFVTNLSNIQWFVRTGELDFVLIKPVSPLFYLSFNRIELGSLVSIFIGLFTLFFSLKHLPAGLWQPGSWLLYVVFLGCGILLLYSLMLLIVSFAFWTTRASSVQGLFWAIQEFGGYPLDLYQRSLRWVLTFIIPVGLIANVPARAVLGGLSFGRAAYTGLASLMVFLLARMVFYAGLQRYRSASS